MYNYYEEVKEDVRNYIDENRECYDFSDRDELEEKLYDDLWIDDSVTGNGSGSYTFSRWEAEENLCHNMELLQEALSDFGQTDALLMDFDAEAADITIRCYLLGSCLSEVLDELE